MKRFIDQYLLEWSRQKQFKPLLLRGARQVGKTYAVRQLGKQFDSFVELNLEFAAAAKNIFNDDLDPVRIIRDIALFTRQRIIPGKTLLFLDEVQAEPRAVQALRYFYEQMPQLHIIAAGSLFDFVIESIGMPVGRVQSLYMYPLSFLEFLAALKEEVLIEAITNPVPMSEVVHTKALRLLADYLAIGGMPEVVHRWVEQKDPAACFVLQQTLIDSYRQDFSKYATRFQIKYLDLLFNSVPLQLGRKFKYSALEGDYRRRELAPCVDLLSTAGVVTKVMHTNAQGLPLGAQVDPSEFKLIFLDVALAQSILGLDLAAWFLNPEQQFVNKGELVEALVGQELLAYSYPLQKKQLYYWQRMERSSQAEVDYITTIGENIVPIEVKSGAGSTLKSMHIFLDKHPKSDFGIRFSTQNYSLYEKIKSYPLYAIAVAIESPLITKF